jgi:uncharacterized membrane protein (UPF0182 family)
VPSSEDDSRRELTAFMTASSDPETYGELRTFVLPRSNLPDGPALVGGTISSDPDVASLQTLLGQEGSDLSFGNLLLIPIAESILYVRPLYVESTSTRTPELERVIVVYEGQVAVTPTLRESLVELFDDAPQTLEDRTPVGEEAPADGEPSEEEPTPTEPPVDPGDDVPGLLAAAAAAFDDAQAALDEGDLGLYQEKVSEAEDFVERAQALAGSTTPTTTEDATA